MEYKNNFICSKKRDKWCIKNACGCKSDCSQLYACENCSNSYIPYSQEPCASCYFQSKEGVRKYILEQMNSRRGHQTGEKV